MADIKYFYVLDDEGGVVHDSEGTPVIRERGQLSSIAEVTKLIAEGRPQKAINKYIEFTANALNWAQYDNWKEASDKYEKQLEDYQELAAQREALDEEVKEGLDPLVAPQEVAPLTFEEVTVASVNEILKDTLDEVKRVKDKLNAFEFKGVSCSVCEADQNGWGSITTLLNVAEQAGVPFSIINFKCENGNTVVIESMEEWTQFILLGATARQSFF